MKMLWNKDKTASCKAEKIREITIYPNVILRKGIEVTTFKVQGWYNSEERFDFGTFEKEDEARDFVQSLHSKIAGERG